MVTIETIPIATARPYDEVFDIEAIEKEKGWESKIEQFLAEMESVKMEGMDAASMVISAAKSRAGVTNIEEIPPEQKKVLDFALAKIQALEAANG
jgi:hypothetical protein